MFLKLLGIMDLIAAVLLYLAIKEVELGGFGTWFCLYLTFKGAIFFFFMGDFASVLDMIFGLIFGLALIGVIWTFGLWLGIIYLLIKGGMSLL